MAHGRARQSGGGVRLALDIEDSGLDYLNDELALRSLDLFEDLAADRTRVCSGSACGWVFIDRSKGGRRRWCDMATCGNAEKSRRHYQRTRAGRPPRGSYTEAVSGPALMHPPIDAGVTVGRFVRSTTGISTLK